MGDRKLHTDREYEAQLADVREHLLLMAAHVEQMIGDAMRALADRNVELAHATIQMDHRVNALEMETDELCMLILAKRQPMASDLRFITLSFKMVTDLERIGDEAVNICERAIDLAHTPEVPTFEALHQMSQLTQSMVSDAIDAFIERDVPKALEVIKRDDEVDRLYEHVFKRALDMMRTDPTAIQSGIHLQSVAKWLERMADHCTNLAEQVIFLVKGKDVRHHGKLDEEESEGSSEHAERARRARKGSVPPLG
ncbi:MAG: phosphate signaling complex protein PhoU [Myxococcales bacterium]|nr:phosphate signaling complex protein PhoU [Myxococcales bacterium]